MATTDTKAVARALLDIHHYLSRVYAEDSSEDDKAYAIGEAFRRACNVVFAAQREA